MPDSSDFDLAAYYLNQRRLAELAGANVLANAVALVGGGISARAQAHLELAASKDVLLAWLRANRDVVRPLEEFLLLDNVRPGSLFTVVRAFCCRNVRGGRTTGPAVMHTKIASLVGESELRFRLHRDHVAPGSPGDLLSGRVSDLFAVGVIETSQDGVINAIPLVIGKLVTRTDRSSLMAVPADCEIHVDHIDSFARCAREAVPGLAELGSLRGIPEESVKTAFAEIMGEPLVPKDWGGERSDLFTSYLRLDGRRVSAAFVFKGPARPTPMSLAHLGARGDQIVRLMTEPADVFLLQHCNDIRAEVRHVMRTYALQYRRRYCVITGFDTLRILRAYGKCGLRSVPAARLRG